jgi:uncharacterized protein
MKTIPIFPFPITSDVKSRPSKATQFLIVLAVVVAVAGLAGPSYADENSDGVAAARAGDFQKAQKLWENAADEENSSAIRNLAGLYMSGVLGKPDLERARALFEKGAALGDAGSELSLGYFYLKGMGVPADPSRAKTLFDAAAEAGNAEARFMRAQMAFESGAEGKSLQLALNDLRAAADANYPPALARVGDLLRTGTYTDQDIQKAIEYHKKAADFGVVESANTLGDMYLFAEAGSVDMENAVKFYEKAASEGSAPAAYSLATVFYANPDASEGNLARAFEYAKTAAFAWNESAQLLLGRMYLEDRAVPQDLMEAYRWFDLAASAGVLEAHHYRAIAALRLGPAKSAEAHKLARAWFEQNHSEPHVHRLLQGGEHKFE